MTMHQALKGAGQVTAHCIGLKELPVVKVGAIAQAETSQEIVAIERHSPGKRIKAGRTNPGCWMAVFFTLLQVTVKFIYIDQDMSTGIQGNRLAINTQPVACKGFVECRERTAQGGASMSLVVFRPEQSSQGVAALRLFGNCKVGNKCSGLACVNVEDDAIALYARWAHQEQCQFRHAISPSAWLIILHVMKKRDEVTGNKLPVTILKVLKSDISGGSWV